MMLGETTDMSWRETPTTRMIPTLCGRDDTTAPWIEVDPTSPMTARKISVVNLETVYGDSLA